MRCRNFLNRALWNSLYTMPVLVSPPDLARTYNSQSYEDAWEAVEDYQRVLEYTGRHPNKGSSAVASALELPRGRVHPWMEGSRPAPVRAIQIAEERDWLPLSTTDAVFPTFNRLVAWVYSRGSISEAKYSPMFTCHHESERERLAEYFETLGVDHTIYRDDTTAKATEARIIEHRTIVGRLLVLLGAPLGSRSDATTLPSYLTPPSDTAPDTTSNTDTTIEQVDDQVSAAAAREHAQTFADTYLANTARYWAWEDGFVVRHEDHSSEYFRSLATVLAFAAGTDTIEINPDSLFLPTPVATTLCPALTDKINTENPS